jgi:uncharacterized protein (DUF1810 family)
MDAKRFLDAQDDVLDLALAELSIGRKSTHWIWFVFPQLAALGRSRMAKFYGLENLDDARSYLAHPELKRRLETAIDAALSSGERDPLIVFGEIDAVKFRSCLTLFEAAGLARCEEALNHFYDGRRDHETLRHIRSET